MVMRSGSKYNDRPFEYNRNAYAFPGFGLNGIY